MKYNYEKFLKHQSLIGKFIKDKSAETQSSISMINSDTDLKIFIDENKTCNKFEGKVEYQAYEHSKDI